jgi:uncharacterized protein (TIGR02453 family)
MRARFSPLKDVPGFATLCFSRTRQGENMFTRDTFAFLRDLAANNNKTWFEENKPRYEAALLDPALDFIEAMRFELPAFAPHFIAVPKKVGGSLMRIYRDTRFSKDKTPYKINIGLQFQHELGKDVHAPGFYAHVEPGECFLAAGCWRPDPDALGMIRDYVAKEPRKWAAACQKSCAKDWALWGEKVTRAPRGYAADHPAIEDIKRRDFVLLSPLTQKDVTGKNFAQLAAKRFSESAPFMAFLCQAVNIQY